MAAGGVLRINGTVADEKPENVPGLKIVAGYAAYTEHTLYYMVEADDYDTVEKFLTPGFKRCEAVITAVSQFFGGQSKGLASTTPESEAGPAPFENEGQCLAKARPQM